ncbi:MAG: hypothetical protein K1X94_25325 [Sandaracinaceae bacterium]|nr:hypothetical protein [Sandaracinaceae bacterium]
MSQRAALAGVVAALGASTTYVAALVYELAVGGRGDPYLIVRDVHFGYYHRVALAVWVGLVAGLLAHMHLDTDARRVRVETQLTRHTLWIVGLLAIVSFVCP